jgi:hypothetical protein
MIVTLYKRNVREKGERREEKRREEKRKEKNSLEVMRLLYFCACRPCVNLEQGDRFESCNREDRSLFFQ